ncbi:MAG: DUF2155 domain-containing protein [Rickettsiales bacterium]|jgi:hypothetical protein|nr:DUF2155 domain-containing protein [Rickettsiales bacterium]
MIKIKNSFLLFVCAYSFAFAELKISEVRSENTANTVVILALDKLTSKSYKYRIKIGESVKFNRINITPLFCWKSLPDEFIENKALVRITGNDVDGSSREFFYGWFFSSSPSISVFEHPMYGVKLVNCENVKNQDTTKNQEKLTESKKQTTKKKSKK